MINPVINDIYRAGSPLYNAAILRESGGLFFKINECTKEELEGDIARRQSESIARGKALEVVVVYPNINISGLIQVGYAEGQANRDLTTQSPPSFNFADVLASPEILFPMMSRAKPSAPKS